MISAPGGADSSPVSAARNRQIGVRRRSGSDPPKENDQETLDLSDELS